MMGAIHLDHFTEMMLSLAPLPVLPPFALLIGDVFLVKPKTKGLIAQLDLMNLKKLLVGKGRAEIAILPPIQLQHLVFDLRGETTIRSLAAGTVADAIVSFLPYPFEHPPKLPAAQIYKLCSRLLGDPFIQCLVDNVQSFCFSPAQSDHVLFRHNTIPLRPGIVT